jgi:hypothetical protein
VTNLFIITALFAGHPELPAVDRAESADGHEIVYRYLAAAEIQKAALRGSEVEVRIQARLCKLGREGAVRALRRISSSDEVSYVTLDSTGDSTVKRQVIARFLTGDTEYRAPTSVAITPANYEFRFKGTRSGVHVFQLKPRKKRVGLFKGELWLDAETGMPVRESGEFARSPSIFLKRVRFVRDYEMHGNVSLPQHLEITVETRLAGRAELHIEFNKFTGFSLFSE